MELVILIWYHNLDGLILDSWSTKWHLFVHVRPSTIKVLRFWLFNLDKESLKLFDLDELFLIWKF